MNWSARGNVLNQYLRNTSIGTTVIYGIMDLLPSEQNFDVDKSRQKFHHSLKEHHKASNIPKFRCEML